MINLNKFPYDLTYRDIEVTNQPLYNLIPRVTFVESRLNHMSFDNNLTNIDNYNTYLKPTNNKTIQQLQYNKFDGMCYYYDKKLLVIPSIIDDDFNDETERQYNLMIAYYNLDENNIWGHKSIKELPETFPIITNVKFTTIERKYYPSVENNTFILYDNMPKELYDNVYVGRRGIIFDVNSEQYITKYSNQEELYKKIKYIAENGFSEPLKMYVKSNGLLISYHCSEEFMIARYLNLPSIPVAFIIASGSNDLNVVDDVNNMNNTNINMSINSDGIKEILKPYILLN